MGAEVGVVVRRALDLVAIGLVTPLLGAHRLRLLGFPAGSQLLSLVPGQAGRFLRRAWYSRTLAGCGRNLVIDFGAAIRVPGTRIGDNCYIGVGNWIGWADIGDDFMSGPHVDMLSGASHHRFDDLKRPMRLQGGEHRCVIIGPDVWIGAHATIMADVAAHSIVASGAVVTKLHGEWEILAGVPARRIRDRRSIAGSISAAAEPPSGPSAISPL